MVTLAVLSFLDIPVNSARTDLLTGMSGAWLAGLTVTGVKFPGVDPGALALMTVTITTTATTATTQGMALAHRRRNSTDAGVSLRSPLGTTWASSETGRTGGGGSSGATTGRGGLVGGWK